MSARSRLIQACLLCAILCLSAGGAFGAEMEGQKPMVVIGDVFRFVPGSWATYSIHDRVKQEHYRMYIATLEKTQSHDKPYSWMEVEVTPAGAPPVVSRFLVEETKGGPGEILDVIIQIEGYPSFIVPTRFYEGKGKEIGEFQSSYVAKRLGKKTVTVNGKPINAWEVEASDKKDRKINAIVSDEVPPLGIVNADTEKTTIHLVAWGTGAKSKIEGSPITFYLWMIKQLGQNFMR